MQTIIHRYGDTTVAITGPAASLEIYKTGVAPITFGNIWLRASDVASVLGSTRQLVHYRAKRGLIPAPHRNERGQPRWNAASISAFLASRQQVGIEGGPRHAGR